MSTEEVDKLRAELEVYKAADAECKRQTADDERRGYERGVAEERAKRGERCACEWTQRRETIGEAAPFLSPCAGHQVYGDWREKSGYERGVAEERERARLLVVGYQSFLRWASAQHCSCVSYCEETVTNPCVFCECRRRVEDADLAINRLSEPISPSAPQPAKDSARPHIVGGEFQSDKYPSCPEKSFKKR